MITKKYIIQNWHLFYFNYKKAKFWFRFHCFLQYPSKIFSMFEQHPKYFAEIHHIFMGEKV